MYVYIQAHIFKYELLCSTTKSKSTPIPFCFAVYLIYASIVQEVRFPSLSELITSHCPIRLGGEISAGIQGAGVFVTPDLWLARVSGAFLDKWGAADLSACLSDVC